MRKGTAAYTLSIVLNRRAILFRSSALFRATNHREPVPVANVPEVIPQTRGVLLAMLPFATHLALPVRAVERSIHEAHFAFLGAGSTRPRLLLRFEHLRRTLRERQTADSFAQRLDSVLAHAYRLPPTEPRFCSELGLTALRPVTQGAARQRAAHPLIIQNRLKIPADADSNCTRSGFSSTRELESAL